MQGQIIIPVKKFSVEDGLRESGKMVLSCLILVAEKGRRIKENIATTMTKKQDDEIPYAFFLQKK
jgi:hypothetical protein